jgi:hypothetical protein
VADYVHCPSCAEPIAAAATHCPCCARRVPTAQDARARELRATITARRLGAFLTSGSVTALFRPPRLEVADGRVRVVKWTFFTLRVHHQEIRIDRVASVQYTKGVFWGGLLVETFGGAAEDIDQKGFEQTEAREMAQRLKELIGGV